MKGGKLIKGVHKEEKVLTILDIVKQRTMLKHRQLTQQNNENTNFNNIYLHGAVQGSKPLAKSNHTEDHLSIRVSNFSGKLDLNVVQYSFFPTMRKSQEAMRLCITVLEQKVAQFQEKLREPTPTDKVVLENIALKRIVERCTKFYQKGRHGITSACMELIECKAELGRLLHPEESSRRIDSINRVLGHSQQLIEVYSQLIESQSPCKPGKVDNYESESVQERLEELRLAAEFQGKIIEHLRNEKPQYSLLNQTSLLRYEVNRISLEKEDLLKQIQVASTKLKGFQTIKINASIQTVNNLEKEESKQLLKKLANCEIKIAQNENKFRDYQCKLQVKQTTLINLQKKSKDYSDKVVSYSAKITEMQEQIYKISMEKDVLMDLLEQNDALKNQAQNTQKHGSLTIQSILDFLHSNEANLHRVLIQQITQYEDKIYRLNENFVSEKLVKDKVTQWGQRVCYCLQRTLDVAELSKSEVKSLLTQYEEMSESQQENSLIEVYAAQIKGLTVGLERQEIDKIQDYLKGYIDELRSKTPTLQEVEGEDGSVSLNSFRD